MVSGGETMNDSAVAASEPECSQCAVPFRDDQLVIKHEDEYMHISCSFKLREKLKWLADDKPYETLGHAIIDRIKRKKVKLIQ